MAKIEVLDPICNSSGAVYYGGFVNGKYAHFMSYNRLTTKQIMQKLIDIYEKHFNIKIIER